MKTWKKMAKTETIFSEHQKLDEGLQQSGEHLFKKNGRILVGMNSELCGILAALFLTNSPFLMVALETNSMQSWQKLATWQP